MDFTHVDAEGRARMVDVTKKAPTDRYARASVTVEMSDATLAAIVDRRMEKGDVLQVARVAGIMAAKRVHELIPLCHQIPLGSVAVDLEVRQPSTIAIVAKVRARAVTGVEMEALMACSVSALTVYDMCKALDRGMVISNLRLEEKRGGKSDFLAQPSGCMEPASGAANRGSESGDEPGTGAAL